MELMKAIGLADGFCPNHYTLEEKLLWCHEVSAGLRRKIKRLYETIETRPGRLDEVVLPDGIETEDIAAAYLNGHLIDKADLRDLAGLFQQDTGLWHKPLLLRLVCLTKAEPVRNIEVTGEFDLSENRIGMEFPPFREGDTLECVLLGSASAEPDWSTAVRGYVMETDLDGILLQDDAFTPQTGANLAIRRVIDDLTEVEAPYDTMYVEYLLAKMAHYQHDYEGYTAHMTQYNNLYEEYKRNYKLHSPLTRLPQFRNFW